MYRKCIEKASGEKTLMAFGARRRRVVGKPGITKQEATEERREKKSSESGHMAPNFSIMQEEAS